MFDIAEEGMMNQYDSWTLERIAEALERLADVLEQGTNGGPS